MGPVQKPSRPISTGKGEPRGGAKTATDPKGANNHNLGLDMGPVQKPSRPVSASKVICRGPENSPFGPMALFQHRDGLPKGRDSEETVSFETDIGF